MPVNRVLYPPAVQAVHTDDVDAEAALPYKPDPHAVHVLAPVDSALYAPVTQDVQTNDVAEEATLPYEPALQAVQREVPVARLL